MTVSLVAQFEISYTRVLGPDGDLIGPLPAFAADPTQLKLMLAAMWRARRFDRRAVALQRTGSLGTFASGLGQEAVGVGTAAAMVRDDVFLPSYRDSAAQLMRQVRPMELLQFWLGDERGSNHQDAPQDFPICITVGGQALHAAGVAFAMKIKGERLAAVTISGDGSTSKGEFYEALNVAGVYQLPVVFVVANNQWAISVPRQAQSAAQTLAQKAIAAGIPGEQVDGNDVIAMRAAVAKALERARSGRGATLIEALTYRLGDHTTSDDASRYRSPAEVNEAWQREPIRRLSLYLEKQGAWSKNEEEALLAAIDEEIEAAVRQLRQLAPQSPASMFDYVFARRTAELERQRQSCLSELGETGHDRN